MSYISGYSLANTSSSTSTLSSRMNLTASGSAASSSSAAILAVAAATSEDGGDATDDANATDEEDLNVDEDAAAAAARLLPPRGVETTQRRGRVHTSLSPHSRALRAAYDQEWLKRSPVKGELSIPDPTVMSAASRGTSPLRLCWQKSGKSKEESASARSTRKKEERERPRVVKGAKATTATKALATKLPRQMTLPEVDISVSGDVDNAGPSSHPIPAALVGRKPRNRSTSTTTSVTRDDKPSSTTPSLKGKEVGLSNKAAAANYFDQRDPIQFNTHASSSTGIARFPTSDKHWSIPGFDDAASSSSSSKRPSDAGGPGGAAADSSRRRQSLSMHPFLNGSSNTAAAAATSSSSTSLDPNLVRSESDLHMMLHSGVPSLVERATEILLKRWDNE